MPCREHDIRGQEHTRARERRLRDDQDDGRVIAAIGNAANRFDDVDGG